MIDIHITPQAVLAAIWLAKATFNDDIPAPPSTSIYEIVKSMSDKELVEALTDSGDIDDITIDENTLAETIHILADQTGLDYPDQRIEWNIYANGITVQEVIDLVNADVWTEQCDFCGEEELVTNLGDYPNWEGDVPETGDYVEIGLRGNWVEVYACYECLEYGNEVIQKLNRLVYGRK